MLLHRHFSTLPVLYHHLVVSTSCPGANYHYHFSNIRNVLGSCNLHREDPRVFRHALVGRQVIFTHLGFATNRSDTRVFPSTRALRNTLNRVPFNHNNSTRFRVLLLRNLRMFHYTNFGQSFVAMGVHGRHLSFPSSYLLVFIRSMNHSGVLYNLQRTRHLRHVVRSEDQLRLFLGRVFFSRTLPGQRKVR